MKLCFAAITRVAQRDSAVSRTAVLAAQARTMCSKIAREWYPPKGETKQQFVLYNSLVDEKVPFVPAAGPDSKNVTWYICGPTVYDSTHMGHARNYVTFDIVRRILEDYFGYNVQYVMNITDVDDKIILRARRNYLLSQYVAQATDPVQVRAYADKALAVSISKQESKVKDVEDTVHQANGDTGARKRQELEDALRNETFKRDKLLKVQQELQALPANAAIKDILAVASDSIAEALDKEKGATVTDHSIYKAHSSKYEAEFFEDMDALGCRRPDVLTRVTEYIPEIVNYVQQIIDNGMAYAVNGSVYFDTSKFRESGHTYGKLKPWAVGSATLAAEGEANFECSEKRSPQDFALWKMSKPGEPFWESPWGQGRPGWHIECSAMASAVIGQNIDIHTGGDDLKFPHHDNELAQAEAYYHKCGCRQWVNYFLHSGHLEIEGLKMSKSLKNFITIRETLKEFSPRQVRLIFLLSQWNKPITYGSQCRSEMKSKEALLKNFFQNVEVAIRENTSIDASQRWTEEDTTLNNAVIAAQNEVHACLQDNLNTSGALSALSELVRQVNVYMASQGPRSQPLLLRKAAAYVTRILTVFGLTDGPGDKLGLSDSSSGGAGDDARLSAYLTAFSSFRDEMRALARGGADKVTLLTACDRLRDEVMVELGVRLEDKPDGKSVWKLESPEVLRKEVREKALTALNTRVAKASLAVEKKKKEVSKFSDLLALPPLDAELAAKYSKCDPESGEPTHDKEGNALEGKAKDKARKEWEKLKKVREPLLVKQAEDPGFMNKMQGELVELTQQLEGLNLEAAQLAEQLKA